MLTEGQILHGKCYDYEIVKKISQDFFLGILKVRGDLGQIDSGFQVDVTTKSKVSSSLIEKIRCQGNDVYIYTHKSPIMQSINGLDWIPYGEHKYRGQVAGGLPHGEGEMRWKNCNVYKGNWKNGAMSGWGIMIWPSGKRYEGEWTNGQQTGHGIMFYPNRSIYEGEFYQGARHGHGILRQPNGEYIEGEFINDHISEQSVFVDIKGNKNKIQTLHKKADKSILSKFWSKTWTLWMSIACFCLAALFAIWLSDFFSGKGPSHISARGIIAPFAMIVAGFKFLIDFFSGLSNNN